MSDEIAVAQRQKLSKSQQANVEFPSRKTDQIKSRDLYWSREGRRTSGLEEFVIQGEGG
jgi:hypothetical protein